MTTRNRTQAVYVISVAAELAGMHPQTLRIYERRGLVNPARTQGGNRRYSDADIETLQRIAELAEQGMNLEGIRRVMELEYENARLRDELLTARQLAATASQDAERRHRRDLVPLRQAVAVFGERPRLVDGE
jgi:MerR family transcriptional regulator/heat shock protein HspR